MAKGKLTPALQECIVTAVAKGHFISSAVALHGGIGYSTVRNWLKRGERPDSEPQYREFYLAVQQARAEFENRMIAKIETIGDDKSDWRAHQFLLASRSKLWGNPPADIVDTDSLEAALEDVLEEYGEVTATGLMQILIRNQVFDPSTIKKTGESQTDDYR